MLGRIFWMRVVFGLVLTGAIVWITGSSASFKECIDEGKNAAPYKALHESASHVGRALLRLDLDGVCAGEFTDKNQGSIAALATAALAFFTFTLWRATSGMLASAKEQSGAMERSIAQATLAAKAMQSVADSMAINVSALSETVATNKEIAARQKVLGEMQLRAYISVVIGGAIYQDRENKLRFEGRPMLVNDGNTPANRVVHKTIAAILPVPLPNGFVLPEPQSAEAGEGMIGPRQNRILTGIVSEFVDDGEVASIKRGDGKALYVWGSVNYEDAFRKPRRTDFCQILTWLPNGALLGYYVPDRNTAT